GRAPRLRAVLVRPGAPAIGAARRARRLAPGGGDRARLRRARALPRAAAAGAAGALPRGLGRPHGGPGRRARGLRLALDVAPGRGKPDRPARAAAEPGRSGRFTARAVRHGCARRRTYRTTIILIVSV